MKKFLLLALIIITISSCVETIVIASGATAIAVTRQKNLEDTKLDIIISANIDKEIFLEGLATPRNSVSAMVSEGRVLLCGTIRDLDKGKKLISSIWKIAGVKELIDEVEIDDKGLRTRDFTGIFLDSFITAKIKSKLFFSRKAMAANFKISTVNSVVYVIGVAKNDLELKSMLESVSRTSSVKKVVNHAILANDERRKE